MSTNLRVILAHLIEDPRGCHRRPLIAPRDDSSSSHFSSSQEEVRPKRERRPPRQPAADLRDMKIDPSEFEGSLNPDLFMSGLKLWKGSLKSKTMMMKRPLKL